MKVSKPALLDATLGSKDLPFEVFTLQMNTKDYEQLYHIALMNREILVLGASARVSDFPVNLGIIRGQLIASLPSAVQSGSFSLGLFFANSLKPAGSTFLLGDYDPAQPGAYSQQIIGFEPWKPGDNGTVQFTFDQQFPTIAPTFPGVIDGYLYFGLMNNTGVNGNYDDWCKPPVIWHGFIRFSTMLYKEHTVIQL